MSLNTNTKTRRFGPMLATIFMLLLLGSSQESCMTSGGALFRQHLSGYLDAEPFHVSEIQSSSECLLSCERDKRCNAVNIKAKNGRKICELLSGDSTTLKIHKSSTSSFFEITQSSLANVPATSKVLCQPECQYIPSCESNPLARCRCVDGTMLALHWNAISISSFGDNYAAITVNIPSGKYRLKLVSVGGFISCIGSTDFDYYNNFGCMKSDGTNEIRMVVTSGNNTVLLPGANGYSHDGKKSKSTFVTFNDPIDLEFGQDLRIWYKDDLEDHSEADNAGLTYIRALALSID